MFIGGCQELETKLTWKPTEAQTQRPDFGESSGLYGSNQFGRSVWFGASGAHGFFEVCLSRRFPKFEG